MAVERKKSFEGLKRLKASVLTGYGHMANPIKQGKGTASCLKWRLSCANPVEEYVVEIFLNREAAS